MLLLFAAALASSPAPQTVVRANARVTVRIISGARISPGKSADAPGQQRRRSRIRLEDGTYQAAQLIEFN
jgi:hypothetical protein